MRLYRFAGIAIILTAAVTYGGFTYHMGQIANHSMQAKADGVVVLTGDSNRISQGVQLLNANSGKRLLISGVGQNTSREAIANTVGMSEIAAGCCVDIDRKALDTKGNATHTGQWAKANGYNSLIVVTSDYHMPRALFLLQQQMPDVELHPAMIESGRLYGNSVLSRALSPVVFKEYLKYMAARMGIEPSAKRVMAAMAGEA